jgi:hypothetical protein
MSKKHLCPECDDLFEREAEYPNGGAFFLLTCRVDGLKLATGQSKETIEWEHKFTKCPHDTNAMCDIQAATVKVYTRDEPNLQDMGSESKHPFGG